MKIECPVCGSNKLEKYKEIRQDTQELEFLCRCAECGEVGDFLNINDAIYYWSQLKTRRIFTSITDYSDDSSGSGVMKTTVNYDEPVESQHRIKSLRIGDGEYGRKGD